MTQSQKGPELLLESEHLQEHRTLQVEEQIYQRRKERRLEPCHERLEQLHNRDDTSREGVSGIVHMNRPELLKRSE